MQWNQNSNTLCIWISKKHRFKDLYIQDVSVHYFVYPKGTRVSCVFRACMCTIKINRKFILDIEICLLLEYRLIRQRMISYCVLGRL